MVSVRQVHFIEQHWEAIGRRALASIRKELPHSHAFSDAMILERVEDLFGHLGDWLTAADPEQMARYEKFGYARAAAHVRLFDLVRMLQILRQCAIQYLRDNELNDSTVTLRSEGELESDVHHFFDLVICHVVKGFEEALREKPHASAQAV